jgi:hypothetical protein
VILVGFKSPTFEVISWQCFDYCVTAVVKNQIDKIIWRLLIVYGSPYVETKLDFVNELHMEMGLWQGPTLVGGDFNLVMSYKEKSNGAINFAHANLFNDWINCWGLIEIKDTCRTFT